MEYLVTIECTQRRVIPFNANSDDEAEAKAAYIQGEITVYDMPTSGCDWDYCLKASDGRIIEDWEDKNGKV